RPVPPPGGDGAVRGNAQRNRRARSRYPEGSVRRRVPDRGWSAPAGGFARWSPVRVPVESGPPFPRCSGRPPPTAAHECRGPPMPGPTTRRRPCGGSLGRRWRGTTRGIGRSAWVLPEVRFRDAHPWLRPHQVQQETGSVRFLGLGNGFEEGGQPVTVEQIGGADRLVHPHVVERGPNLLQVQPLKIRPGQAIGGQLDTDCAPFGRGGG